MKYALIAVALLLGALLPVRADILPLLADGEWTEALNIRGPACFDKPDGQTSVHSQTKKLCPRDHTPRRTARAGPRAGMFACKADVLHSEELTGAPIFFHYVKAALLVTPPNSPAFETTTEELIPWQVPPLRRGERLRLWCDPANPSSVTFH